MEKHAKDQVVKSYEEEFKKIKKVENITRVLMSFEIERLHL
jgi:hypothetical protein